MSTVVHLPTQDIQDVTVVRFEAASFNATERIQQLAETLCQLIESKPEQKWVLDFADVIFLSSAALGALVTARKKVEETQGKLILSTLNQELLKLFKVTTLDKLFRFSDDKNSAIEELNATAE